MEARDNRGGDGQEAESGDRDSKRSKRVENGRNRGGGGGITQMIFYIFHNRKRDKGSYSPLVPPSFQTWNLSS